MQASILPTLALGFALGLKHATEADHLAAVSTIVSTRRSIWQSARVGALWGMGHMTSLFVAGLLVIVLGIAIPQGIANILEFCVALMIIALGTRLLYLTLKGSRTVHFHAHTHGGSSHFHIHIDQRLSRWRAFLVGVVHGLAGSAALTLLVLTEVMRNGSRMLGLSYLLIFGVGSIGGMLIMSSLIGIPFVLSFRFLRRVPEALQFSAAIASLVFGVYYGWQIIF